VCILSMTYMLGVAYILFGTFRIYLVLFLNALNVWMLLKC